MVFSAFHRIGPSPQRKTTPIRSILFMACLGLILLSGPVSASVTGVQYTPGEMWVIDEDTVIDGESMLVTSQIFIDGANLTITGSTITFGLVSDGAYGIQVNATGKLIMTDSHTLSNDTTTSIQRTVGNDTKDATGLHYPFVINGDATITGSTIDDVYSNDAYQLIVYENGTPIYSPPTCNEPGGFHPDDCEYIWAPDYNSPKGLSIFTPNMEEPNTVILDSTHIRGSEGHGIYTYFATLNMTGVEVNGSAGFGIFLFAAQDGFVRNSSIHGSGAHGIFMVSCEEYIELFYNNIYDNGGAGLYSQESPPEAGRATINIFENRLAYNLVGIISDLSDLALVDNTIELNTGDGVYARESIMETADNIVRYNGGTGFNFTDRSPRTMIGNEFTQNGLADVLVTWALGMRVVDSTGTLIPGSTVTVTDALGSSIQAVSATGQEQFSLVQYMIQNGVNQSHTPHTIAVNRNGMQNTIEFSVPEYEKVGAETFVVATRTLILDIPPETGDWFVASEGYAWEGSNLLMEGNIIINNDGEFEQGTLRLANLTLTFNSSANAPLGFIMAGGTLILENVTIRTTEVFTYCTFEVFNNLDSIGRAVPANVILNDTTIHRLTGQDAENSGIQLTTSNLEANRLVLEDVRYSGITAEYSDIILRDTSIEDVSEYGIRMLQTEAALYDTVISGGDYGIMSDQSLGLIVNGTDISGSIYPLLLSKTNLAMVDSHIHGGRTGIEADMSRGRIESSYVYGNTEWGINMRERPISLNGVTYVYNGDRNIIGDVNVTFKVSLHVQAEDGSVVSGAAYTVIDSYWNTPASGITDDQGNASFYLLAWMEKNGEQTNYNPFYMGAMSETQGWNVSEFQLGDNLLLEMDLNLPDLLIESIILPDLLWEDTEETTVKAVVRNDGFVESDPCWIDFRLGNETVDSILVPEIDARSEITVEGTIVGHNGVLLLSVVADSEFGSLESDEANNRMTRTVTINGVPVAVFQPTKFVVEVAESFTLTAAPSDFKGENDVADNGYIWDMGDSTRGRGESVDHFYTTVGNYTVKLEVVDTSGSRSSTTRVIRVIPRNYAPRAVIESPEDPGSGWINVSQGTLLHFSSTSSSDEDGTVVLHEWSVTDGGTGNGTRFNHTFNSPGGFRVTLTVTDDLGKTDEASILVNIKEPGGSTGALPAPGILPALCVLSVVALMSRRSLAFHGARRRS